MIRKCPGSACKLGWIWNTKRVLTLQVALGWLVTKSYQHQEMTTENFLLNNYVYQKGKYNSVYNKWELAASLVAHN